MSLNPGFVRRALESWKTAELDPETTTTMQAALDRIDEIGTELQAATSQRDRVPEALANSEMGVADGVQAQREQPVTRQGREQATELATKAKQQVVANLVADLRRRDLLGVLSAAHDAVISEASTLAARVDGIDNDRRAIMAPSKNRDAWARLTVLDEQRRALIDVRLHFNRLGVLDAPTGHEAPPLAAWYGEPDRIPTHLSTAHPARALVDTIVAGADPRLVRQNRVARTLAATGQASAAAAAPRAHARVTTATRSTARSRPVTTTQTGGGAPPEARPPKTGDIASASRYGS